MAVIAKQRYKLDIAPSGRWGVIYASQHDDEAREIEFEITNQGKAFSIPASINVSVQGIKANKSYFSHSCSYSGNVVTMALADDMTDIVGKAICVLKFTNSSQQKLATAKFILNVDSDSSSEGIIIDTEAEEIFNQMLNDIRAQAASVSADIAALQSMVGSPLVASTVSAMTDHNKIYVYTGSESGYTNGNWYYWNGSAWTSGGVYNSTAFETDKTLSVENMPADANEVGHELKIVANLGGSTGADYSPWTSGKTILNTGKIGGSTQNSACSEFIRIPPYVTAVTVKCNGYSGVVGMYSDNTEESYINRLFVDATGSVAVDLTNTRYIRIAINSLDISDANTIEIRCSYVLKTTVDAIITDLNKKFGFVKVLTSADDLDDYYETGAYCWLGSNMPIHSPVVGSNCVMSVSHGYGNVGHSVQYVSSVSGKFLQRIQYTGGDWTNWVDNQNNSRIDNLKDELIAYNSIDVFSRSTYTQGSSNGITYTRNADGSWTISGTATGGNSFCNIIASASVLPEYIRAGRTYHINFNGGNVPIRIYTYFSDGTSDWKTINESSDFTIPENTIGIAIRWQIPSGTAVDTTVNYTMIGLPLYVSKEGDTIQNIYNYNNTYDIDTNPTITTDSHGWLEAIDTDTSDETGKTDMTGAIMSMLNDTGYCHLGEGIFYVSGNIDMPEGSTLCGCGKKTIIRLLQSVTTGYCVKIGKYCTIKDISFEGARSFTVPSTKGTRNGIAFIANYNASPSVTTEHCMISNVWCKFFSGAGIYCHNTSINYAKGVYVINAFINACYAGIDIDYYSEFNKFVNVCTSWCKYGCINNGGNNVFSSCTFHATEVGFYIDGTQPNHGHGTLAGCTFCHIGSNAGIAIKLESVTNGFVVDACQVWYNSINIISSSGVIISNCELGRGTTGAGATINITNGATILFTGCMFMDDANYAPDINVVNNDKVKFTNCFGSVSGNAISA